MKTKFRGSVLVVSMLVLSAILIIALGVSLNSVRERKASIGESKSNQAFQTADSGIEKVMQEVVSGDYSKTNNLSHCDDSDGIIKRDGYEVELRDSEDVKIDCDSDTDISEVASIKSTGTAGGQKRAIEAAVAASGDYQISCAGMGTNTTILCCRINTSTGDTECAGFVNQNTWVDYTDPSEDDWN